VRSNSRHRLTRSANSRGGPPGFPPTFWLPLPDIGSGAVGLVPNRAGGSSVSTFTRATPAWTKLSTGPWASVGTGVARSCYLGLTTAVGAYGGYLAEAAATNLCLQSRDMTNASWTKTNVTAAKDQVGIDGVTNSASSLTATAISGSCLQTITEAATASALSMFILRITGSGTITIQQGVSTLEVSGSLNSSTYTRVELDATVLNPAIGIVFGTNGDKIAVDMVQFENVVGGKATSPIPTTTVAVTRNADVLEYPSSGNVNGTVGTFAAQIAVQSLSNAANAYAMSFAASRSPMFVLTTSFLALADGAVRTGSAFTPAVSVQKVASNWSGVVCNTYLAGVKTGPLTFDGDMNVGATLDVGSNAGAQQFLNGMVQSIKLWTTALTDGQIASL
jgi:hypothetical protein